MSHPKFLILHVTHSLISHPFFLLRHFIFPFCDLNHHGSILRHLVSHLRTSDVTAVRAELCWQLAVRRGYCAVRSADRRALS
jgi:hypothetical protein